MRSAFFSARPSGSHPRVTVYDSDIMLFIIFFEKKIFRKKFYTKNLPCEKKKKKKKIIININNINNIV